MKHAHDVNILCIKHGECLKTGVGAKGRSWAETKRLFAMAKRHEVPSDRATFCVDLHDPKGDLIDSILIDGRGFRALTNEPPPTLAQARKYDHRISKALRFGLDEIQPEQQPYTNAERITNEMCDLIAVTEMLVDARVLTEPSDGNDRVEAKKNKVRHFMKYARELGTLEPESK